MKPPPALLAALGLIALPLAARPAARQEKPQAAAALPGVERRIVVAPAETVFVADAGSGDVVVLIPGVLGSAYQFRHIAPLLGGEGFRVVAIELPGVGRGARPDSADYSLTAQADRVAALLDSLGVERAFVIAHSVGGSIALRAAYRHGARVRGLLLLEAGPTETATTPGFRRALRFDWLIKLFGGMGRIRGRVRGELRDKSADPAWVTPEVVEGYMVGASDDLDSTLRGYKALAAATEPDSLAPNLHLIRVPVLLLLGGHPHEGGPPSSELELMLGRVPAFAVDTVPAAGHFPQEEAPQAVVAAMLRLRAATACVESAAAGAGGACLRSGG